MRLGGASAAGAGDAAAAAGGGGGGGGVESKRIVFIVPNLSHVDASGMSVGVDPALAAYKVLVKSGSVMPPSSAVIGAADIARGGGGRITWTQGWHALGLLRDGMHAGPARVGRAPPTCSSSRTWPRTR